MPAKPMFMLHVEHSWCMHAGTELEEEDVLSRKVGSINGRPAYEYESFAPYGTNGTHQLSKVVTKASFRDSWIVAAW